MTQPIRKPQPPKGQQVLGILEDEQPKPEMKKKKKG
jgi:hypothetical protein